MAGLYELWRDDVQATARTPTAWVWSCTVLTTEAVDDVGRIHDRMPMMFERDGVVGLARSRASTTSTPRGCCSVPAAPGLLEAYPVSTRVNKVDNNGIDLLDPVTAVTRARGRSRPRSATRASAGRPPRRSGRRALLVALGHGAGGGIEARDLAALARELPAAGIAVVRVEQPWRVAGKRVAAPAGHLDKAWLAGRAGGRAPHGRGGSARRGRPERRGTGRVPHGQCRRGCRRSSRSRSRCTPRAGRSAPGSAELLGADVPALVVQGERDRFGGPAELPAGPEVVPVPGADHGFKVPASRPPRPGRGARAARLRRAGLRALPTLMLTGECR